MSAKHWVAKVIWVYVCQWLQPHTTNWINPKNLQKFSCIWAAYHQQKHPSLNVFKRWESLKSGTRGFQFFFLATNCWKLQIGSSTLWWALGRVDASYLHIKGFWQQQKIRRMQNNMMAWYFGQVLLIKWCLTKSPTFIFYPWNDNRWVLDTVLKSLQWRRKYCLRKYFWASECSKEQLATEALYFTLGNFFPS